MNRDELKAAYTAALVAAGADKEAAERGAAAAVDSVTGKAFYAGIREAAKQRTTKQPSGIERLQRIKR